MKTSILRQFVIIAGTVTFLGACGGKVTSTTDGSPGGRGAPLLPKPTDATAAQGSQAVVCRNDKGVIQSVELADLVEAKQLEHVTPALSTLDLSSQVTHFLDVIAIGVGDRGEGSVALRARLQKTADRFLDVKSDVRVQAKTLSAVNDSLSMTLAPGCVAEQLVRNEPAGATPASSLNEDLFLLMTPSSQAATIAHEALQADLRETGEANSGRTRQMIAAVASGATFAARDANVSVDCVTANGAGAGVGQMSPSHVRMTQAAANLPIQISVETLLGVPRMNPRSASHVGKFTDFVTDAVCLTDQLTKIMFPIPDQGVGRYDAFAVVIRACHLSQVSMYIASDNTELASQIRTGRAQRLSCKAK